MKKALQELCKLLRSGALVHPHQIMGLEQTVVGALGTRGSDEKVRRWALNALARFGRAQCSLEPVKDALTRYSADPQTAAAGIAALYRLAKDSKVLRTRLNAFDPVLINLAALQHVSPRALNLNGIHVDVERSTSDLLKLGLILVGLNRAPVNLFHPNHSNSELVKALGRHHDPVVSQYSVWAITENNELGLSDLGIDIKDIENLPPNVRAWIFRLLAMSPEDAKNNLQYIQLGMSDPIAEARSGLATGLRDTFFDGLEPLMLDWFGQEAEEEIGHQVVDHMVRKYEHCISYENLVKELYEKESSNSTLRQRMEANASGTPLYASFKMLSFSNGPDLFRGTHVVNNINIGKVQAGAFAIQGEAKNTGGSHNLYNEQVTEQIQNELAKALVEIRKMDFDEEVKNNAIKCIEEAQSAPKPGMIRAAIQKLSEVEGIARKIAGTSTVLSTIIAAIQLLIGP